MPSVTMTPDQFERFMESWGKLKAITLGTKVPYAKAVQEGRPPERPRRQNMPPRPFFPPGVERWVASSAQEAVRDTVDDLEIVDLVGARARSIGIFAAAFKERMFARVHNAFQVKSLGGRDDLGVSWAPLSAEAVHEKGELWSARGGRLSKRGREKLWNEWHEQTDRFKSLLASNSDLSTEQIEKIAAERAWRVVSKRKGQPINVRTGRLEKSLRPGRRRLSRYFIPTRDQIARHK